jgi:hypothetical protein
MGRVLRLCEQEADSISIGQQNSREHSDKMDCHNTETTFRQLLSEALTLWIGPSLSMHIFRYVLSAVYLDPNWLCRLKMCRTDIWGFRAWSCVAESNSCTFKQYKDNGRWRHCDISKRQVPRGQRHSFISPKIWIDSKTAVIFSWSRFKHKTAFWFWKKRRKCNSTESTEDRKTSTDLQIDTSLTEIQCE